MTETDTIKFAARAAIQTLKPERPQLDTVDTDDHMFYELVKYQMDALLQTPRAESLYQLLAYSRKLATDQHTPQGNERF